MMNKRYTTCMNIAWQYEPKEEIIYIQELRSNEFYTLENSSISIWYMLVQEKNIKEIIESISNEYEIDYDISKSDVINFINQLLQKGFIVSLNK